MQIAVEVTSNLGRRITINIPANKLREAENKKISELSNSIKINGFRNGKVPQKLIKQRFNNQVKQEVISQLIEETLRESLKQEKLSPAGLPHIDNIDDKGDEGLQYVASFEIFPEIKIKDFSEIKLEKMVADITEDEIKKAIEELQDQLATFTEITDTNRIAQNGDQLNIDFVGTINNEKFEHGSEKGINIELGSNKFIPGFEEGLLGAKVGDKLTLNLTFPENYNKDLAGKNATFEVIVNSIKEKSIAKLDEVFAKHIGIENGDVNAIKDKVRSNMKEYMEKSVNKNLREQALDKLLEIHTIEVPEALVQQQKEYLMQEKTKFNKNTDNVTEEALKTIEKDARERAAFGLLLREIIKINNLNPDAEKVKDKIQELAISIGGKDNYSVVQKMYYESKELLSGIQDMVLTEQIADLIVAKATIVEKQSTFYDIAMSN